MKIQIEVFLPQLDNLTDLTNRTVMMQENQVEEMEGVEMTKEDTESQPILTEQESRILDVYDRLEELQLEIELLKAQGVLSQGKFLNRSLVTCSYSF
jgi:hypothetical protein